MTIRSALRFAIAMTLLAVPGCTADAQSEPPDPPRYSPGSISYAVRGDNLVRLDAPFSNELRAVALWFHGQGGDVNTRMNQDWLNVLRHQGWAVASGDLGGSSWGNDAAVQAAQDLQEWATVTAGVPVKLIVAGSMGAATSLNAMAQGRLVAPCWYGTMPVYDLRSLSFFPSFDRELRQLYPAGIPPQSNPAENSLPGGMYRVVSSNDDTQVISESNADILASRAGASVLKVSGEHGDSSHFNDEDLKSFASECLRSYS